MTKVYAHRGFSSCAPENTTAAFNLAIKAGVDGIELDVHATKEGKLVILHDETIDRTTNGTGWVKDLSLEKMKQLDSGSWFSSSYSKETIPTLGEVLELVKKTNVYLNIELKNNLIAYPKLEEHVVKEIEKYGMEGRVILSSFNHVSLYNLHLYRPEIPLGVLYDIEIDKPWDYAKNIGASSIHPLYQLVTDEVVTGCHENRLSIRPYTVDVKEEMKRLISFQVDAIITNMPDRLKEVLLEM